MTDPSVGVVLNEMIPSGVLFRVNKCYRSQKTSPLSDRKYPVLVSDRSVIRLTHMPVKNIPQLFQQKERHFLENFIVEPRHL